MKKIALALLLAGCPGDWTYGDTARETTLAGLSAVDWHQTRTYIAKPYDPKTGYGCSETNPFIGNCGQRVRPDYWFAGTAAAEIAISRSLPHRYRQAFHWFWIGVEATCAWNNWRALGKI